MYIYHTLQNSRGLAVDKEKFPVFNKIFLWNLHSPSMVITTFENRSGVDKILKNSWN